MSEHDQPPITTYETLRLSLEQGLISQDDYDTLVITGLEAQFSQAAGWKSGTHILDPNLFEGENGGCM